MTVFLMIFPKILTIFQRFPKVFQNWSEGQTNIPEHFPRISENFQRCPKIVDDFWEAPKMFPCYTNKFKYNLRGNLILVKSSISSHARTSYLHMWAYRIVFINLLPLGIPLTFIYNNIMHSIPKHINQQEKKIMRSVNTVILSQAHRLFSCLGQDNFLVGQLTGAQKSNLAISSKKRISTKASVCQVHNKCLNSFQWHLMYI